MRLLIANGYLIDPAQGVNTGKNLLIEDGQVVGRLIYEPLLAPPAKLYGRDIGSSYQAQKLTLSKHFKRP